MDENTETEQTGPSYSQKFPKIFKGLSLNRLIVLLIVVAVLILVIVRMRGRPTLSRPQEASANYSFSPATVSLTPDSPKTDLTLNLDVGSTSIIGVQVALSFNSSNIKLSGEIDVSGSPLTTVVRKTSMSEANTTGKMEVVLAAQSGSSVSNTVKIAKISLERVTTQTTIDQLNFTSTQTVDTNNNNLEVVTHPATINLN